MTTTTTAHNTSLPPLTFQFPSLKELNQRLMEYWYEPVYVVEVVGSLLLFLVGNVGPHYLSDYYALEDRPIPIGVTSGGDTYLDLQYSYDASVESSISGSMNVVICFYILLPLLVLLGLPLKGDAHASFCMYFVGRSISGCLVACLKLYCGYFRPHFYSKCQLDVDTGKCMNENDKEVMDAHHSFPSGHSALAFCTMTMLTLLWMGKVGPQRLGNTLGEGENRRMMPTTMLWKKVGCLLALLPMGFAVYISASRIHDYKHHPADVLAGMLIGYASATFAHSLYYPSVNSNWCAGYPLEQTLLIMSSSSSSSPAAMWSPVVGSTLSSAVLQYTHNHNHVNDDDALLKPNRSRRSTLEMTSDDEIFSDDDEFPMESSV
mmetsp:Transcript_12849/g.19931  ORF Transcript_12849/g.19931 Transcript_12849/m.19931 type:complete len:376 (+) Transcript_12849:2255-3382(+)